MRARVIPEGEAGYNGIRTGRALNFFLISIFRIQALP